MGLVIELLRVITYTSHMPAGIYTLALLASLLLFDASPSRGATSLVRSTHQPSAIIRIITLKGNTAFTDRQILDLLSSRQLLPYSEAIVNRDLQVVLQFYQSYGYLDAQAELRAVSYSSDSSFVEITIGIAEGHQSVLARIEADGNHEFSTSDVLNQFDLKPGDVLVESALERDIANLLERYERRGFPFTRCAVAGVTHRSGPDIDSLDVALQIHEGERVTIEEIRVEGNKETDASVVVREMRVHMGDLFNPTKLEAVKPRLTRLNIFSSVSEPELYLRNGKGGLLVKVQEGRTSTFDGVIGYIPGTAAGQAGYVTGLASISMRNLFGTGRKLSFRWQREDRFSQELGLRYLEPWLLGVPANIGGGFLQRQQDTSYVRRVFDLKGELMFSEELSISLLFSSENVIPSSDSTILRAFRSSTTTFGGEILYDTRDDNYSPTSGTRYRTDYQYGRKRTSNIPTALVSRVPQRTTVQKFSLDLDVFLSPFQRQVVAVGFHGRELRSGQLEESEMFRLGGARTLRGYRESQFIGSRVAWMNTEYRFLLARRTFVYGFIDNGYYLRPADDVRSIPRSDSFKLGYGIGVQLETGLGNIGVSFALGEGDTFTTGKIHFGLINEF